MYMSDRTCKRGSIAEWTDELTDWPDDKWSNEWMDGSNAHADKYTGYRHTHTHKGSSVSCVHPSIRQHFDEKLLPPLDFHHLTHPPSPSPLFVSQSACGLSSRSVPSGCVGGGISPIWLMIATRAAPYAHAPDPPTTPTHTPRATGREGQRNGQRGEGEGGRRTYRG